MGSDAWGIVGWISMGSGYFIETFDNGYKLLRCPDDKLNEMGHDIAADKSIGIDKFKKMCKE